MSREQLRDDILGDLEMRSNGWLVGAINVGGRNVPFGIGILSETDMDWSQARETARALTRSLAVSDVSFRQTAAKGFYDSYGAEWLDDEEISQDELVEVIQLTRIEFDLNGDQVALVQLVYSADDLFDCRNLHLILNARLQFQGVSLE